MAILVYSSEFVVHSIRQKTLRLKKSVNCQFCEAKHILSTVNCYRGFSFVELLVVISIMGVLISITTASYSNFRESTILKNAALQLKSDLRFVQNKALAGDKSTTNCTIPGRTLVGWYLEINNNASSYTLNGICKDNLNVEQPESTVYKTLFFPSGVTTSISAGNVRILFQPLVREATIHRVSAPPYFYNTSGAKPNQISINTAFAITLSSSSGSYEVTVQPTGEISEKKL